MPLYSARAKRTLVAQLIAETAKNHALTDGLLNLAGFLPIPGSGLIGAAGAIAVQGPVFYKPMVTRIGEIYMRPPDAALDKLTTEFAWLGADLDIAAHFGIDFFSDIAGEIITEAGAGWVVTKVVPILGPLLSGGLDAIIAVTLTWRVGVMAASYYENGMQWVAGARKPAYKSAKAIVGGFSPQTEDRVDLNSLHTEVEEINRSAVDTAFELVKMFRGFSIPVVEIRKTLVYEKGMDADIVDAAISRIINSAR